MIIAKLLISFPWEHNTDTKRVNFQSQKKFFKVGLCVESQTGKFSQTMHDKNTMCIVTILVAEIKR